MSVESEDSLLTKSSNKDALVTCKFGTILSLDNNIVVLRTKQRKQNKEVILSSGFPAIF